jgi:hypothetical protein
MFQLRGVVTMVAYHQLPSHSVADINIDGPDIAIQNTVVAPDVQSSTCSRRRNAG